MSNNKGLFVSYMIEHRDFRRFHTEFVTEVATSSTSFNRPIQPPFINKRYTLVRMYRGFGRAKFPNENVHRICTRPSLRVLTCPLRHRVCNRAPISWEGRRSTRFRHSRKIGWNAIRNIQQRNLYAPRRHQSLSQSIKSKKWQTTTSGRGTRGVGGKKRKRRLNRAPQRFLSI